MLEALTHPRTRLGGIALGLLWVACWGFAYALAH